MHHHRCGRGHARNQPIPFGTRSQFASERCNEDGPLTDLHEVARGGEQHRVTAGSDSFRMRAGTVPMRSARDRIQFIQKRIGESIEIEQGDVEAARQLAPQGGLSASRSTRDDKNRQLIPIDHGNVLTDTRHSGNHTRQRCLAVAVQRAHFLRSRVHVTERASIKDVAALAGVSFKTVSRVVNGVDTVLPELRERVEAAVQTLNYVPNSAARSLKSGSGNTIGIIVDSIDDVFFASLVSAVEDRALEHGLAVIVGSTGFDAQRERDQLALLAGQHVRGIILAPVGDHSDFLVPRRRTLPTVTIDRSIEGFDSVIVDDYGSARRAVEKLVASGHTRIALLGFDDRLQTAQLRRQAYLDVLTDLGHEPEAALAPPVSHAADSVRPVVKKLLALRNPPTAFFVANARHATAVVSVLHEIDRTDVAMVSFGNFSLADAVSPSVTCIDQDPYRIGTVAFDRLVQRFDDPYLEPEQQITPTTLVERLSHALPLPVQK